MLLSLQQIPDWSHDYFKFNRITIAHDNRSVIELSEMHRAWQLHTMFNIMKEYECKRNILTVAKTVSPRQTVNNTRSRNIGLPRFYHEILLACTHDATLLRSFRLSFQSLMFLFYYEIIQRNSWLVSKLVQGIKRNANELFTTTSTRARRQKSLYSSILTICRHTGLLLRPIVTRSVNSNNLCPQYMYEILRSTILLRDLHKREMLESLLCVQRYLSCTFFASRNIFIFSW